MLPEPFAATIFVTAAPEKMRVRYLIGGSLASTVHGLVCTTQNYDILAELHLEHFEPFARALESEFYIIDEENIFAAITGHANFNIVHRKSMFKVDVFVPVLRPFVRE